LILILKSFVNTGPGKKDTRRKLLFGEASINQVEETIVVGFFDKWTFLHIIHVCMGIKYTCFVLQYITYES